MFNFSKTKINIKQLESVAIKLAKESMPGSIYLLQGELGSGKTTFARFFINSIFDDNLIQRPDSIKSPSFPIVINYPIKNFEIFHYDLYRLNKKNELKELSIIENLKDNITLVEWPQMIINNLKINNFFLIRFKIINSSERIIEIKHVNKNK